MFLKIVYIKFKCILKINKQLNKKNFFFHLIESKWAKRICQCLKKSPHYIKLDSKVCFYLKIVIAFSFFTLKIKLLIILAYYNTKKTE